MPSSIAPQSLIRDHLAGILFVGLMSLAAIQLADISFIRNAGISPLVVGIVSGMLFGNFLRGDMPLGWNQGIHFTARRLLRIAVAFYGLNISFQQIASVGLPGLIVSVAVVATTLILGTIVGQRVFGLDRDTAMLTAAGSAICGAAAVLAFEPTLRAQPHKSAVAVATVVLFGTLSMFLYPLLYRAGWLSLTIPSLGIYIGGTIHEIAQVVGAASSIDPATTEIATIVKMTRVALLVPALLIVGFWIRRQSRASGSDAAAARVPVPWFAFGFLVLAGINSLNIIPTGWLIATKRLDVFALTMAMTALGMETRFAQIRQAGLRVLGLGLVLYAWLIFGGYWLVKVVS
jgi:uncharacterized integral membrane protein (TIGR00698 family)